LNQIRLFTTLLSGNYIENIHLVLGVLFSSDLELSEESRLLLNRELLFILVKQLQSLEQLIDLIEQHEKINETGYLLLKLKNMRDIFNSFDISNENLENIKSDQIFNSKKVNDLHTHLTNIRTFLITGESRE
jgi:hypothetical protein